LCIFPFGMVVTCVVNTRKLFHHWQRDYVTSLELMGRRDNLLVGNTTPNCKNNAIIIARVVSLVMKTGLA